MNGGIRPETLIGRRAFRAALCLVVFLSLFSSNHQAHAQAKILGAATLDDTANSLALGPYTILQKDIGRKITPEAILASNGTILTGKLAKSDYVFLGVDGTPAWLTVRLVNNSGDRNWFLDFGRRMEGRLGFLRSAHVYEFSPREGGKDPQLKEITPQSQRGIYRLDLDPGESTLLLIEAVPAPGIVSILPIKLLDQNAFLELMQSRATLKTSFCLALGGLSLFFFVAAASRRRAALLAYGAYFVYAAAFWLVYDMMGSASGPSPFDGVLVLMILGYTLLSILLVKLFCNIGQSSYTEKYVIYGLAWLNITATLLSFFLPRGDGTAHASLLYGAPILTLAILCVMSYAQAKNGQIPGYAFCMSWLMPLFGMTATVFGACQIWPEQFAFFNAFWYSLFAQGLFLSMAVHQKLNREEPLERGFLNLGNLTEAKNSADHSQLLKVIEKERQILAEFRQQESHRTEDMRRAKEAADEANRAKSAFLAVVSHEIRTPMTGIMGMVRLLLDSSLSRQQKEQVLTIQESADAMLALLNDILDFEKIQRGKLELENISFDLHRLIQGVVNLMSGHATQKGITLSARMGDDIPRYVKGDPTRLRQVLLNLMGNAIKFTTIGTVTLIVRSLDDVEEGSRDPFKADAHMIYFAVQDTGIGIPVEGQKNLFTPFGQVDSSVARKFGGTGLGLAISKGLIDAMGSTININSQPGEGSTFFFTLSMRRGIAASGETVKKPLPSAASAKTLHPLKILIVDDNAVNCKVVASFLEKGNHALSVRYNADEALKAIEQEDYDLVLMDIELPGMSGNEATRLLRDHSDRAKANVPVIAMTGNTDSADLERYLADGMTGFITKPIDPDKLFAIVADIASQTFEREIRPLGRDIIVPKPPQTSVPAGRHTMSLQDMKLDFVLDGDHAPAPSAVEAAPPIPDAFAGTEIAAISLAPETGDEKIFDASVLNSLKDAIGSDQLEELLEGLIAKTDEILAAMADAATGENTDELAARAHELKGMAGNFGLVEISEMAATAERHAKQTSDEKDGALDSLLADIEPASLRAKEALRRWASA